MQGVPHGVLCGHPVLRGEAGPLLQSFKAVEDGVQFAADDVAIMAAASTGATVPVYTCGPKAPGAAPPTCKA
jgi:hypothetical protein